MSQRLPLYRSSLTPIALQACLGLFVVLASVSVHAADPAIPDAVIQRWEQHWREMPGGAIEYRELRHVRLNSDRAYGEFADPRITYRADVQQVEVVAARTRLPDGRTLDVPAYSQNRVSPSGTAGWPAFAEVQQLVLTLSGLEPGCVIELETRTMTSASVAAPIEADLALAGRYSIESRVISVELQPGKSLQFASVPDLQPQRTDKRWTWTITDTPARVDEPQQPPITRTGPRLVFTTSPAGDTWIQHELSACSKALQINDAVRAAAAEWTRDIAGRAEQIDALQRRLSERINTVIVEAGVPAYAPRPAGEVLAANYGTAAESAILLAALGRSLGIETQVALAIDDAAWLQAAPQSSMIDQWMVAAKVDGRDLLWSPRNGRVQRGARIEGCTVYMGSESGATLATVRFPQFESAEQSVLDMTGTLRVQADGALAGTLVVQVSGALFDAGAFRSKDAQRGELNRFIRGVSPVLSVADFSVTRADDSRFEARVECKSEKPLGKLGDSLHLVLADPLGSGVAGLPMGSLRRRTPVELSAPLIDRVQVEIVLPEGAKFRKGLASAESRAGDSSLRQTWQPSDRRATWERLLRVDSSSLSARDFDQLRSAVASLQTEAAKAVLIELAPKPQ